MSEKSVVVVVGVVVVAVAAAAALGDCCDWMVVQEAGKG